MEREDAKDLTLSILVVVVAILIIDCIWLHVKCARQTRDIEALSVRLEQHVNPPEGPSLSDRAKETYDKVKAAAARGYQAVKEELGK